MRKKLLTALAVCLCSFAISETLWGQNAVTGLKIRGYLDPQTGMFQALPSATEDTTAPSSSTASGKFVFNFTITVDATISSTAKIACSASALVEDNLSTGNPNIITEQASALATRSGTSASCTVNIPYSWKLSTATTDRVMLGYTISAPAEASATASLPSRISSQDNFVTITGAPSGTTTETITATF